MSVPPPRTTRWPRLSLRAAVIALVALTNLAVFAAGLAWTLRAEQTVEEQRSRAHSDLLGVLVGTLVDSRGNLRSASLLRWERWEEWFEDVHIAHFPDLADQGRPSLGVQLDPLGSARRDALHDEGAVLTSMRAAATEGRRVPVAAGVALPVVLPDGRVWGGCWMRTRATASARSFLAELFPWFLASTLALTAGTLALAGRLLLAPIRSLGRAARRIESGDLAARAGPTERRDELGQLVRQFDGMASEIERFQTRLEDEVERATQQARAAEAAAMTQRRLAATGELAAGVAHEINNPLGGLVNAVEVLGREDVEPGRRKEYLSLVRSGLERIQSIVGRLLRLAPRETETTQVALGGPVADALGLVAHRAELEGIALELARGGAESGTVPWGSAEAQAWLAALPTILGQPNELGQALLNLLVNSLDALGSTDGGHVRVACEAGPAEVVLSVADDGPGAPPEVLERAGDAFFTTKDPGQGTGLGLAIVHGIASAHGGRLELLSPPSGGFVARLILPRGAR